MKSKRETISYEENIDWKMNRRIDIGVSANREQVRIDVTDNTGYMIKTIMSAEHFSKLINDALIVIKSPPLEG